MNSLKDLIKKHFSSFVYFYRYLGNRLFVVILLSILIGVLDAFGLTMFLPLLELTDGSGVAEGGNMGGLGILVDKLNNVGIQLTLIKALFILTFFFVLKGGAMYLSEIYRVKVIQYFASKVRINLTRNFTLTSYKSFIQSDIGRVQNVFTSEILRLMSAYKAYAAGLQQLIMTFVYLLFVFLVDWKFALLVVLGGGISNLIYNQIYKKTKKESDNLSAQNSDYHKLVIEYVSNFKYLKATGVLKRYTEKLIDQTKGIEQTNKNIGYLNARIMASREPLLIVVVALVIFIQVYLFHGNLATILMSLLLFYRSLVQLMMFQTSYNSFLSDSGALKNIEEFEKEITQNRDVNGAVLLNETVDNLFLYNISFGYIENNPILKNINLTINKDETISFVGESGSGKTTLVNILCGLLKPDEGSFYINQINSNDIDIPGFQNKIGYISQESVIFNDTVFNNITLWAEPNKENYQKFVHALKQASIYEFVEELELKEGTVLGNNGINLSGGQRQRISIARELYKDVEILILDEATSALDSETETEIQQNIDKLKGKYTIIIIAHRLSTIKKSDIIYLMDKGKIVAQGEFEELIQLSPRFKKMVALQEI